jgi:hypothetical protein
MLPLLLIGGVVAALAFASRGSARDGQFHAGAPYQILFRSTWRVDDLAHVNAIAGAFQAAGFLAPPSAFQARDPADPWLWSAWVTYQGVDGLTAQDLSTLGLQIVSVDGKGFTS